MKGKNDILSLQETEELCRLYMECRLSVLEETELQYILEKIPYSSPIIDQTRESMIAEGILVKKRNRHKKTVFHRICWTAGIAASLIIILTLSIKIQNADCGNIYADNESSDNFVIAYIGGEKLTPDASEKAASESIKKAEALMAMATAVEKENKINQENIINFTSQSR